MLRRLQQTLLQTFAGGLTVPAGQTLTCDGTLAGGTITATTQTVRNNSNLVATTAYVDRLFSVNVLTGPASGEDTLPAQTVMKVYYFKKSSNNVYITDPTNDYIGQTISIHNQNASTIFVGFATTGSSLHGQHSTTFQNMLSNNTVNFGSHSQKTGVIKTFMFLGSTVTPRWIVLSC